jgi:hypothetical protein
MAQRRMFSKTITNSDPFLEMPVSSQSLYFHLGMNADDDGFVQVKSVMRQTGANDDDLKVLLTKGFLIRFADGVIVITAWKINNEIRQDRYKATYYQEHMKRLEISENKCYSLVVPNDNQLSYQMDTQVRLGKVRLGKVRLGKDNKEAGVPPSLSVWVDYCKSMNYTFNFEAAHAYYETNGWRQASGNKIKDWRACAKTCQLREKKQGKDFNVDISKLGRM